MVAAHATAAGRVLLRTVNVGASRGSGSVVHNARCPSSMACLAGTPSSPARFQSTDSRHTSTQSRARSLPPSTATQPIPSYAPRSALRTRIKPVPSSFYSGQPIYTDTLIMLEDLAGQVDVALKLASIPLETPTGNEPKRRTLFWHRLPQMSTHLSCPLKTSHYRHIVSRLMALARYRPILQEHFATGAQGEANRRLAEQVEQTLQSFARSNVQLRGEDGDLNTMPSYVGVDAQGRAYSRGRRKESSARVWIVPTKEVPSSVAQGQGQEGATEISPSNVARSVLVNGKSLPEFFTRYVDREAAVFPLRLTGLLGAFNVFALVQGGGTSGQAGAIAHGISQAIVAHFEHKAREARAAEGVETSATKTLIERAQALRKVLKKDGVLLRDPRMVERKKTGKAKARKAYTWVKR